MRQLMVAKAMRALDLYCGESDLKGNEASTPTASMPSAS